jgi:rhodanese-related sulfurtransferase
MTKHKKKLHNKPVQNKAVQKKPVRTAKSPGSHIWMWAVVGVILLAVTGGFLFNQLNGAPVKTGSLPLEVSVARAAELRQEGAFMLDVREPVEWDEFHMPGATLIPLGQLANRVHELPRDQEIVVVCRSGNRSLEGRDILVRAGFENVTSMSGGMNEWRSRGLPVASNP